MPDRLLVFVREGGDVELPADGAHTVVLSPWWSAGPVPSPSVTGLRELAAPVLRDVDIQGSSIVALDAWVAATGIADLFRFDGVSWWDRVRMAVRWDVYELVLWRHLLGRLDHAQFDRAIVPADHPHLAAACRAVGIDVEIVGAGTVDEDPEVVLPRQADDVEPATASEETEPERRSAAPAVSVTTPVRPTSTAGPGSPAASAPRSLQTRIRRRTRLVLSRFGVMAPPPPPRPKRTRREQLDDRFERMAASEGYLAVTWAGAFQVVEGPGAARLADPIIQPAVDSLAAAGQTVTLLVHGQSHRDGDAWQTIRADERILPFSYVRARCRTDEDADIDTSGLVDRFATRALPGLDIDGCDLGPAVLDLLAVYTGPWLDDRRRWGRWAGRFLDDLRPRAILLDREGTRPDWIGAARARGIPVVAQQHGMIYPGNPEYFRPRLDGSPIPDRTGVFGSWERELLVGSAGFAPDEVVVTGSPRVRGNDVGRLDAGARRAVRASLGVAPGVRMLVVSAAHSPFGELLTACMLATVLDGPLPGIHVVVKLHPQDRTPGDYAGLFAGLAAQGAYEPTAVTVVRDIDLWQLLGAADAHLGQASTVLTDAVAAGVPNMVAIGQAHADPLGYVAAGVAVGVRSVDDVRAFMAAPAITRTEDREAFLAAHFRPGDATERLVDLLVRTANEAAPQRAAAGSGEMPEAGAR